MNFEFAGTLCAVIAKNIVRPPTLEISATPDRNVLNVLQLERAIDPAAAVPFWRADVPIRMIVERNDDDGLCNSPNPKRAQIMKIAGPIKQEGRNLWRELTVKFLDDAR